VSKSPALTLGALLLGLLGTALLVTLPEDPWFQDYELKIAVHAFQVLVSFLLAHLTFGRFRASGRTSDRDLSVVFLILGAVNVIVLVSEIADPTPNDPVTAWIPLIGTAIAAAILCRAALSPTREATRKPSLLALTAFVLIGLGAVFGFLLALGGGLPEVLPPAVLSTPGAIFPSDPPDLGSDLFTAHPVVIAGSALIAVLFLVAAIGFTRNARRDRDELHAWLGAASALAAVAAVCYALLPNIYSEADFVLESWFQRLYAGDLLDLGVYLLLFVGAWRVIGALQTQLHGSTEELRHLTLIDPLTGLRNRRGFAAAAGPVLKLAERGKSTVTVLFVDLDNIEGINESFGGEQGDRALQATSEILMASVRDSDVVARLGEKEFCILLSPGSKPEAVLARIKEGLAAQEENSAEEWMLSLSIGNATFDPELDMAIQEMIEKADAAVYEGVDAPQRET
jgi:diguanylate cyclase (GGDEF)-like protein